MITYSYKKSFYVLCAPRFFAVIFLNARYTRLNAIFSWKYFFCYFNKLKVYVTECKHSSKRNKTLFQD